MAREKIFWVDHEAWLVSAHGTQMKILSALFTNDYLQGVHNGHTSSGQRVKDLNLKHVMAIQTIMVLVNCSRGKQNIFNADSLLKFLLACPFVQLPVQVEQPCGPGKSVSQTPARRGASSYSTMVRRKEASSMNSWMDISHTIQLSHVCSLGHLPIQEGLPHTPRA